MRFMVVERFKGGDPRPIYERYARLGRLAPDGLAYLDSWIDVGLGLCFQLMETDRRERLDEWIANWDDLVDFEIHEVVDSAEAARRVAEMGEAR